MNSCPYAQLHIRLIIVVEFREIPTSGLGGVALTRIGHHTHARTHADTRTRRHAHTQTDKGKSKCPPFYDGGHKKERLPI